MGRNVQYLVFSGVILSFKSIDTYIFHDSSLGVYFAKKSCIVSNWQAAIGCCLQSVIFPRSPQGGRSVAIQFWCLPLLVMALKPILFNSEGKMAK